MENVLDVYQRPYSPEDPVVCMDETSKQLVAETRVPIPPEPGQPHRFDYEYERCGTMNLFMFTEPLAGWRHVSVRERRTKIDWGQFIRYLLLTVYPEAAMVVLVMDNLNTHGIGSLYEAFDPVTARALASRLEIHHTPKHGSWLNMAETELSILSRQCLDRRIDCKAIMISEVAAWEQDRNTHESKIDWQFTTVDARIKLKRLYPSIHD